MKRYHQEGPPASCPATPWKGGSAVPSFQSSLTASSSRALQVTVLTYHSHSFCQSIICTLVPNPNFYINFCGTKTNRMIADTLVTGHTILTIPWRQAPVTLLEVTVEGWGWGCGSSVKRPWLPHSSSVCLSSLESFSSLMMSAIQRADHLPQVCLWFW